MGEAGRHRRLQVLGLLAVLAPFNLVGRRSGGWLLLPLVALALAVGLGVVAGAALDRSRPSLGRMRWFLGSGLASLAALWGSTLLSDDLAQSAGASARISVPFVLAIAAAVTVRSDEDGWYLLRRSVIGTLVALVVGFVVLFNDGDLAGTSRFFGSVTRLGPHDRLTRPWSHANVASMAIGVTGVGVMALGGDDRRGRRIRLAAAAVLVTGSVATYSRGGVAALAVGLVLWVVLRRERAATAVAGGLAALGLVVAVTLPGWSGRASGDERADWYRVEIEAPESVAIGDDPLDVDLVIANAGSVVWPHEGDERVVIAARWFEGSNGIVVAEQRWPLLEPLRPSDRVRAELELAPDLRDGDYLISWDLLVDQRAYFRQFNGDPAVTTMVRVAGSSIEENGPPVGRLVPLRRFVGRSDLYRRAVDLWQGDPVLGIGPGLFGATMSRETAVSHAHSLALEPLATVGLAGALPMLALLGLAGVSTLRRAWHRDDRLAAALTISLAVVAVHGLVEWPLVHIGVGVPLGLVIGIVTARERHPVADDSRS